MSVNSYGAATSSRQIMDDEDDCNISNACKCSLKQNAESNQLRDFTV